MDLTHAHEACLRMFVAVSSKNLKTHKQEGDGIKVHCTGPSTVSIMFYFFKKSDMRQNFNETEGCILEYLHRHSL